MKTKVHFCQHWIMQTSGISCWYGVIGTVKLLLERETHLEVRDDRGKTTMVMSDANNHRNIFDLFRHKGASTDTTRAPPLRVNIANYRRHQWTLCFTAMIGWPPVISTVRRIEFIFVVTHTFWVHLTSNVDHKTRSGSNLEEWFIDPGNSVTLEASGSEERNLLTAWSTDLYS